MIAPGEFGSPGDVTPGEFSLATDRGRYPSAPRTPSGQGYWATEVLALVESATHKVDDLYRAAENGSEEERLANQAWQTPVSYTHLTLPTSDLV